MENKQFLSELFDFFSKYNVTEFKCENNDSYFTITFDYVYGGE